MLFKFQLVLTPIVFRFFQAVTFQYASDQNSAILPPPPLQPEGPGIRSSLCFSTVIRMSCRYRRGTSLNSVAAGTEEKYHRSNNSVSCMQTLVMRVLCPTWLLYETTTSQTGQVTRSGTALNRHYSVSRCAAIGRPWNQISTCIHMWNQQQTAWRLLWPPDLLPLTNIANSICNLHCFHTQSFKPEYHAYSLWLTKLCRVVEVRRHVCPKYYLLWFYRRGYGEKREGVLHNTLYLMFSFGHSVSL
jgi:hypothetical protein